MKRLRGRELLGRPAEVLVGLVDVAQGDDADVWAGRDAGEVRPPLAADADRRDAKPLVGAVDARPARGAEDRRGAGLQERAPTEARRCHATPGRGWIVEEMTVSACARQFNHSSGDSYAC